jgi:3-oxoacyl-[acyl-carrier-protein] synthase-3
MKHLTKKCGLPEARVPFVLERYGNSGGPSVALALTQGVPTENRSSARVMALGYGVGLSWGAAVARIGVDTVLVHSDYDGTMERA